jgi:nucleoside-diphosphate-sugar epimerase
MRVLLAGGRGFISSHLVESLLTVGADLTMVDNVDSFSDLHLKERNMQSQHAHSRWRPVELDSATRTPWAWDAAAGV